MVYVAPESLSYLENKPNHHKSYCNWWGTLYFFLGTWL
jgi:hypothetical protein